ncbi:MAG: hypothetical protein IKY83_07775 [Proteobacteria bacterium]|nr:hypothetical protein [Pseudomonadota bacterium]
MKTFQISAALTCAILSLTLTACQPKHDQASTNDSDDILADVNGEYLRVSDLDYTETWLPPFARQLEDNSRLEINRIWSLIQIIRLSQDAQEKAYLTPAERSLAIKEALAKASIHKLPYPNFTIEPAEIDAYIAAHPDQFFDPPAFTVNYALIKNENTIPVLTAAWGLTNGAQMGYNFIDPPELDKRTRGHGPLTVNVGGHPMDAKHFNFAFVTHQRENQDEPAQLGPFTASDGLIFSCPDAIDTLQNAPLGQPITHSLACSGVWKAFVIPEWRRDAAPMSPEKSRQVATEKIMEGHRAEFRKQYIQDLKNKS